MFYPLTIIENRLLSSFNLNVDMEIEIVREERALQNWLLLEGDEGSRQDIKGSKIRSVPGSESVQSNR